MAIVEEGLCFDESDRKPKQKLGPLMGSIVGSIWNTPPPQKKTASKPSKMVGLDHVNHITIFHYIYKFNE